MSTQVISAASALAELRSHNIWAIDFGWLTDRIHTLTHADAPLTAAPRPPQPRMAGRVAVLPLRGALLHRAGLFTALFGGTATEQWIQEFRDFVDDKSVSAIVIDVDSPGGTIANLPETAAEIYRARKKKPTVAVANSLAASAAYWLGTAAEELYMTPSSVTGSIGVWSLHLDFSRQLESDGIRPTFVSYGEYKTELNPLEPLSAEAREYEQSEVDRYGELFVRDVAKFRGVTASTVKRDFGQGRLVGPATARITGMVDGVLTLDETVAKLAAFASRGLRTWTTDREEMQRYEQNLARAAARRKEIDKLATGLN